jgi:hypothetical protein
MSQEGARTSSTQLSKKIRWMRVLLRHHAPTCSDCCTLAGQRHAAITLPLLPDHLMLLPAPGAYVAVAHLFNINSVPAPLDGSPPIALAVHSVQWAAPIMHRPKTSDHTVTQHAQLHHNLCNGLAFTHKCLINEATA